MNCALKFRFKASNNEAEYEALIVGLELAKEMKVESLDIFSDSQLVVCQINNEYQAREGKIAAYLHKVKKLLEFFSSYTINQISRSKNVEADALTRLSQAKDADQLKFIPVDTLSSLSIQTGEPLTVNCATTKDNWMTPVVQYLKDDTLPEDRKKARPLRLKAARYTLYDNQLYKRGFSTPLLKCVNLEQENHILQEIHEGICSNHARGQSLAYKALRQGYF